MAPWQRGRLAIGGADVAPAFMVRFDAGHFDPVLFSRHGVVMPASIAASVQKRQAEFFFGRYCAAQALAELGMPASEIAIGASREPLWPAGVIGSITHAGTVAAAIAMPRGRHAGIGIDIEHIVGVDECAAMRSVVVNASECAYLVSLAASMSLELALTIAFSAKESFFKAVFAHVRRHLDFDAVMVEELSPSNGTITLELTLTLSACLRQRHRCQLHFREMGGGLVLTSFLW